MSPFQTLCVEKQYLPIVRGLGPLEFIYGTASLIALGLSIATFINSRKDKDEIKSKLDEIKKLILNSESKIESTPNINPESNNPKSNNIDRSGDTQEVCKYCGSINIGEEHSQTFQDDMEWVQIYKRSCQDCKQYLSDRYEPEKWW